MIIMYLLLLFLFYLYLVVDQYEINDHEFENVVYRTILHKFF